MSKTYSTKQILSNPVNMKVWEFGHVLSEILKEDFNDVTITPMVMESDFIEAAYKGKSWKKDYDQHLRIVIKNKDFELMFNALDKNTIDLFSIVVKKQKQGIGNDLMMRIILLADELDIDISLIPVAMSSSNNIKAAEKAAKWLRDWYDCMRFSECEDSPEMIYHAGWAWKSILGDHYGRLNLKQN